MSPSVETAIRSAGVVIAFALCGWLENVSNLSAVVGANWAGVIAGVAAVVVAMLDKHYSPNGTVVMGSFGSAR